MRLPGATYEGRVKSLGRLGNESAGALTAHAEEVLTTQTARNAVIKELQGAVDAGAAWIDAREQTAAELALADYRSKVRAIETKLDTTPAIPTKEIPEGVQVKRETSEGGQPVEREFVPMYEVRAQLFDQAESKARQDALSQVSGKYKAKLLAQINEFGGNAANGQAAKAFEGERAFMVGTRNAAVEKSILAGDIDQAASLIDSGMQLGLYSVDEARQMTSKAFNQHETLQIQKTLYATDDPNQLRRLAITLPEQAKYLSPAQKFELQKSALDKADAVAEKQLALADKARAEYSADVRADLSLQIQSKGQIPWDQIPTTLKPADRMALYALNKAAGESRSAHSDPAVEADLQARILNLSVPSTNNTRDRVAVLQQDIIAELTAGRITSTTASTLFARATDSTAQAFTTPDYNYATDKLYTIIVGGGKSSSSFFNNDPANKLAAVRAEDALRAAMRENPNTDPNVWVDENVHLFVTATKPKPATDGYIVKDSKGQVDIEQSKKNIANAYRAGKISKEAADAAVNAL